MASQPAAQQPPRPLVHLQNLEAADLPPHPNIRTPENHNVVLLDFLQRVLNDGVNFADTQIPRERSTTMASPPSMVPVEVLKSEVTVQNGARNGTTREKWVWRRSLHRNAQHLGTATFEEFDANLRARHSVHELEWAPTVYDAHLVASWAEDIATTNGNVEKGVDLGGTYTDVTMDVYEMCHNPSALITNRAFPVVVITAKTDSEGFVVIQIPVNLSVFPNGDVLYANGRNRREADTALRRKKTTPGMYVSVERVTVRGGEVQWVMATASDAKGNVPKFLQKTAVPKAVVKDVGSFFAWLR
ncbi:hypothetical protein SLS58_004856 [Diplodia intermedia]|uniref:DUF3074 domain-containing protein n=1 Tax=Diplodia intermedia TaxID=856260 RepID=A0ABR3TSK4_9PEZI